MAKMQEITCACGCGRKKLVRLSDIKRGWGKYFSKSCKAKHQEKKTGQYRAYLNRIDGLESEKAECVSMDSGLFGHGQD